MSTIAYEQGQRVSVDTNGAGVQAMRANKLSLVERFADDLAHEIKNPLHSMVINLEVLKRRISRAGLEQPDELLRYTRVLASELDRVNRRVELLLRLVRPDRPLELTSLPEAVDELIELLELERDRRGIQIVVEPTQGIVRPHIRRDQARQIVLNLLLFMLDRLRSGARLEISTERDGERIQLLLRGEDGFDPDADIGDAPRPRLDIARALAESSGGQLTIDGPPGPVLLTVDLPLTPAA